MSQGNHSPVARNVDRETVNELTEATQAFVGDQKQLSTKRGRLHRTIARLRVANRIEEEQAKAAVDAAVSNLRRIREINAAEEEVWRDLLDTDAEDERCITAAEKELGKLAHRAGSTIVHQDLLNPKEMVQRQRELRRSEEISPAEADVI